MKLTIYNGSPRRKKSNSLLLINHFLEGYNSVKPQEVPVYHLAGKRDKQEQLQAFKEAETVIIIFPLYTDCMPGIVKEFIEEIAAQEYTGNKKIGFIVQSGFPEAIHSVYVERYLEKLSRRLKFEYLGTIIKGGVEGIQVMPEGMTKKLFTNFNKLGKYFAETGSFSSEIKQSLRKPYKMSKSRLFAFKALQKTGLTNFYWNGKLKEHNAFDKRFAAPYASESNPAAK